MKKFLPVSCFLVIILTRLFVNADTGSYEMKLPITSKESLMRIGTIPLFVTENGKKAAAVLWGALETNDMGSVKKVIQLYEELLQKESKTGDYGSLKWLCECIAASEEERKGLVLDQLSEDFYKYFIDNNYANLKEYLLRKYKVNDYNPEDVKKHLERRSFLEDIIMFNNPKRNDWEKSDEIIKYMNLNKGDSVIDIGCGFGFYAYRFSGIVGKTGKVWAVDTSEPYIDYINKFVEKYKIKNIVPVTSQVSDISVRAPADVAFMCSVYHIIYGWSREADRVPFINSIRRSLKQGGTLVIADNSFANGDELNSCYLNKELAIAQLTFYGFKFVKHVQITPQRYLLIFKHEPGQPVDFVSDNKKTDSKAPVLNITSGNSVIHIGSLDSYDITEKGIEAAKLVYDALKNKNMEVAEKAVQFYDTIIPLENFGGEYTALQWFCEYLAAPQQLKAGMLKNPLVKAYYDYLAKDDYKVLKKYVDFKYKLNQEKEEGEKKEIEEQKSTELTEEDREIGRTKREFLEDFILFNNPKREEWEKTSRIMDAIGLKNGDTIADIGSGSGYYTYKFSQIVGEQGKVYAIDVKDGHLDFIGDFVKSQKIKNIQLVKSKMDDICLEEKVDYLFICSLYHMIYGVASEANRADFIGSIKKALKKGGRFIIVDNGPVESELMPYHGPYITKELIISQLSYYGFTLEKYDQIIPQRYMLTFKLN